jgi:chromosome segregation ATPase
MSEPRMFTEDEHLAVLADRVAKETASLSESLTSLNAEKAELQNKLDVAEAAKVAAETAAAAAEKALEDFKAELEAEKAAAEKKEERLAAAKAAASHLPEEFFADEARVARIVAMSDEQFAGYVADLGATHVAPVTTTEVPKETAMSGSTVAAPSVEQTGPSAAAAFLLPGLVSEGGK